jgi:hypothetical protein
VPAERLDEMFVASRGWTTAGVGLQRVG